MRAAKRATGTDPALIVKLRRDLASLRHFAKQVRKAAEIVIDKMKDVERDMANVLDAVDRIEADQGASTTRRSVGATRGHRRRRPRVTPD
jgi:hypothetical protein